jgi:hypothetical protein
VDVGSISQTEGYLIVVTPMDSIFGVDGACTRSALTKNEGLITPRTILSVFSLLRNRPQPFFPFDFVVVTQWIDGVFFDISAVFEPCNTIPLLPIITIYFLNLYFCSTTMGTFEIP